MGNFSEIGLVLKIHVFSTSKLNSFAEDSRCNGIGNFAAVSGNIRAALTGGWEIFCDPSNVIFDIHWAPTYLCAYP
jgi:hypothetical protein